MEHYAWTLALTRMVSAVFRRGGDVSFVAEELKAVFDPRGGSWMGGRYVPSIVAAPGDVVHEHLEGIKSDLGVTRAEVLTALMPAAVIAPQAVGGGTVVPVSETPAGRAMGHGKHCPKCSQPTLIKKEGCETCTSCLYSKCSG